MNTQPKVSPEEPEMHIITNKKNNPTNPKPTVCPRCHKSFKDNPARKGMSCAVFHGEGSCCHYSQTEVKGVLETEPCKTCAMKDKYPALKCVEHDVKPDTNPIPTDWTRYITNSETRNAIQRLIAEINERIK